MGGCNRIAAMTGATVIETIESGLYIKFPNRGKRPNSVWITLDRASDTYSVRFARLRALQYRDEETLDGIYCDQLVELFESKTGLYLSL